MLNARHELPARRQRRGHGVHHDAVNDSRCEQVTRSLRDRHGRHVASRRLCSVSRQCGSRQSCAAVLACRMPARHGASRRSRPNVYAQKILVANRPGLAPGRADRPAPDQSVGHRAAAAGRRRPHLDQQRRQSQHVDVHRRRERHAAASGRTEDRLSGRPADLVRGRPRQRHRDRSTTRRAISPASRWSFRSAGPPAICRAASPVPIGTISGSAKFVFVTTDGTINAWRAEHGREHGSRRSSSRTTPITAAIRSRASRTCRRSPASRCRPAAQASNRLYVTDFQNSTIRVLDNQWTRHHGERAVRAARRTCRRTSARTTSSCWTNGSTWRSRPSTSTPRNRRPTFPGPARDTSSPTISTATSSRSSPTRAVSTRRGDWRSRRRTSVRSAARCWSRNFGDGTIAAFDPATGAFRDYLRDDAGKPIVIDKIWGLAFGNGVSLGDADSLYFTAGPNEEQDGIFGRLRVAGSR